MVLLAGGTGFTGQYVAAALTQSGERVRALVRDTAKAGSLRQWGCEVVVGDLGDEERLTAAMRGCDTLVNVASLGFGHAGFITRAASRAGMERAIYFSSTSLFTTLPAASKAVRLEAERTVRACAVPAVILRPTMIFGTPGDRNLIRLIRFLDRSRILPVPGPGTFRQQPVYVHDLARAVPQVLASARAWGRDYNVSGGTVLTYNELVAAVGAAMGIRVHRVHVPLRVALAGVAAAGMLMRRRISREQILRLNEDKIFDPGPAIRDWDYRPTPFAEAIAREVALWRGLGAGSR